jgi:RNA polymerase primary sigma factor
MDIYLKDVGRSKLLTKEREAELARQIKDGDESARDELISSNLKLVVTVAKRFIQSGVDLDDLIAQGNIGLVKAVDNFDPDKGRFSTYAWMQIQRSIQDILGTSRDIHVPLYVREDIAKWVRASSDLAGSLNRAPSVEEIIDYINELYPDHRFNPEKVSRILLARVCQSNVVSCSKQNDDEHENEIASDCDTPEQFLEYSQEADRAADLINTLSERDAKIMRLRFGINEKQHNLQEIGNLVGLTRERVRQIIDECLEKMRLRF